jgi:hypothetical protein
MSSQMTSDQAKFLLALTLPTIKTEHETTKRVIEAIPLDKGDYRPEPRWPRARLKAGVAHCGRGTPLSQRHQRRQA